MVPSDMSVAHVSGKSRAPTCDAVGSFFSLYCYHWHIVKVSNSYFLRILYFIRIRIIFLIFLFKLVIPQFKKNVIVAKH